MSQYKYKRRLNLTEKFISQFTAQTITTNQQASPDKVITKCPKPASSGNNTTTSRGPAPTSDQSNTNSKTSGGLSGGAIGGIVAGVVVALLAAAIVAFFCFKKKRGYVGTSGVNIDGDGDESKQVYNGRESP